MSLLDHTPQMTAEAAAVLADRLYGLDVVAVPLPGERDLNFRLDGADGRRYVLKIVNGAEDPALLAAQGEMMVHLAGAGVAVPRPLPTRAGPLLGAVTTPAGVAHPVRLATYLPGIPLGALPHHPQSLLHSLGDAMGRMATALADFDHPAAHRAFHWDLLQAPAVIARHRPLLDGELAELVDRLLATYQRHTAPLLERLPRGVIHNDPNDYNVLADGDLTAGTLRVSGIIDFGDLVHSLLAADPAVAAAYVMLDHPDPLAALAAVAAGYHARRPLSDEELAALFGLATLRLCLSAAVAADQMRRRPDDPYLAISQAPIRRTLPRLAAIHPRLATAALRHACGLDPAPAATRVVAWLRDAAQPAPVLTPDPRQARATVLDLGVGSPLLAGAPENLTEPALTARIGATLAGAGSVLGVGQYDEPRLIYTGALFGERPRYATEQRTIHLGLDLFAPAGSPVFAPLPGVVHAVADNQAPQDYGPVLVLRHAAGDGTPFFTLYGHLSRESLTMVTVGQAVDAGAQIGTLGGPAVNGGWTPHLHLQLMVDLLDLGCDFPGVAPASRRAAWTAISPDPNLLARVPAARFPRRAPAVAETLSARRRRLGPNLSVGYRQPLKIERGWMQYLYDDSGRQYVDAYNNVPHVGHCHPRVVAAGRRQMGVLNTNTRYLHDLRNAYAERLAGTMPEPLRICYFLNSASEANELALRLARAYTGRRDMLVVEGAYHGHTTGLIDISPYKHDGPGGGGAPDWVHTVPLADLYRGPIRGDHPAPGEAYADLLQGVIAGMPRPPAAFIAESCPSVGGQIIFPDGYLAHAYAHVRAAGGLCIADEVQTGYGRIGSHFYAFEAQDVVPDIVVLGKPIGNGHPIAAVVTTPEVAAAFDNGMEFFSTFGGNTVSCAVGLAVLDVLEDERLQQHARRVGEHLLRRLRPLLDGVPLVGDVRGAGLFLGVELVENRESLAPAARAAAYVSNRMREEGVLLGTDGPHHNVIKIRPPLPFSADNADYLAETLGRILKEIPSP